MPHELDDVCRRESAGLRPVGPPRHRRRAFVAALSLAAAVTLLPPLRAYPSTAAPTQPHFRPGRVLRAEMVRELKRLGTPPSLLESVTGAQQQVDGHRTVEAFAFGDVNSDGTPEVLEMSWVQHTVVDPVEDPSAPVRDEITRRLAFRDGGSGRRLWARSFRSALSDGPIYPIEARVGAAGKPGVIVVEGVETFWTASFADRYLRFTALRGIDGKTLWSRTYQGAGVPGEQPGGTAAADTPLVFDFFQGIDGRATDILLGIGTSITIPVRGQLTATTRTVVVDGADGSEKIHPIVDVGIDWIPYPSRIPDTDGDGLDDYAVINNRGLDPGENPGGEGGRPPRLGGVIHVRRGYDGEALWSSGGHEFAYYALVGALPDVVGGGAEDFAIQTTTFREAPIVPGLPLLEQWGLPVVMLVDSSHHVVRWAQRNGAKWALPDGDGWYFVPGNVDGRGGPDVVVERPSQRDGIATYRQVAFSGDGRKIWTHSFRTSAKCPPLAECFSIGSWMMGDLGGDGVRDAWVSVGDIEPGGGFGPKGSQNFLLDTRKGRTLLKFRGWSLTPTSVEIDGVGEDLVEHTVEDARAATFTARRGSNGSVLWRTSVAGPPKLLSRRSFTSVWGGIYLPGDPCADIVFNLIDTNVENEDGRGRDVQSVETFYGVLDGATGRILWSEWTGAKADEPRMTHNVDRNPAC